MNKSSYIIYLTKSENAARMISRGLFDERETSGYHSVGSGAVHEDQRIPPIFHNCGYYYAYAEILQENQTYQLIIC